MDVCAGRECSLASTGDNNSTDTVIRFSVSHKFVEFPHELQVQCVQNFWSIQRHYSYSIHLVSLDHLEAHTVSRPLILTNLSPSTLPDYQ